MQDVEVISRPEAAIVALDSIRARLLRELATPQSAAMLAATLGLPRQKLNYHLRQLEAHGLVALHEERTHGGLKERVLVATAHAFYVDPAAAGGDDAERGDRLSARYLVAVAARSIREVGRLARRSSPATLTIDTVIGFATPDDRAAFADEFAAAVAALAAKYHQDGGRPHRLVVAAHEIPEETHDTA
jgi:DNA-binding transcriptional ArsR family regulator